MLSVHLLQARLVGHQDQSTVGLSEDGSGMAEELGFFDAMRAVITPLTSARSLFSILEQAERQGVLTALRDGATPGDVARAVKVSEDWVDAVCAALIVNGVADSDAGEIRLTPPWRALTAEDAFQPLRNIFAQSRAIDMMLSTPDATYSTIAASERSAFAHSVSPNPYSRELVARIREDPLADPWFAPMHAGGRYLELGCGIAGRMLTMLQAMPRLHAVGVELDPVLADEARDRAADLGLADRVDIVTGDATTYRGDEAFDFGFWSQWFFPTATRADALASMFANLRTGGIVRSPVFGEHERMAHEPFGEHARQYSLDRVLLASWGVPERTPDQLATELAAAGFIDISAVRTDATTSIYARRP
ncbi:hypothetical protein GCM10027024_24080 [Microbacterium insulae]